MRRARDARDQRHVDRARARCSAGSGAAATATKPSRDAAIALHRQPFELDREQEDQHVGEHEHRHREAEHREAPSPRDRSRCRPCAAAITPSGTATSTATISVHSVSDSVGSTRWPISCVTGRLVKIEVPRSPCSERPRPSAPNRTRKGWSSPSLLADAARCPRRSRCRRRSPPPGRPGVRYSSEKTNERDHRHDGDGREQALRCSGASAKRTA